MGRLNLILLSIAVVFLYVMLQQVGWENLGRYFQQVGYQSLLLLIPYGIMNLLAAIAWQLLLKGFHTVQIPLPRLFLLRLGGESLNLLTPTASLGGEPFKAYRLKAAGISWQQATASLVIHKGLMVMSLIVYVSIGLILLPLVVSIDIIKWALLCVSTIIFSCAGLAFIVLQKRNPCAWGINILGRWGKCPAFLLERRDELTRLDAAMAAFYRENPKIIILASVLLLLNWLLQGWEVYLIFQMLGHPVGISVALCIDALAMLFTAIGFMVPAQLGVQDGGNVLIAIGFKIGAAAGLAFSVIRRIREALWLLVGLVVVTWEK